MEHKFLSYNEDETINWGQKTSQLLAPGDVIGFFGELGSGKTRTIAGICQGLGCGDQVSSPTFTIINEYQGIYPVYHFDLYRIDSEQEIFDLGYEEYFYNDGICLIEWAERVQSFLPPEHIEIYLKGFFKPGQEHLREILFKSVGPKMQQRNWDLINLKQSA
ncbi:MAG: tRNA (adenosine(37)-N6)-threonylcarbamoyltransferase complex ATPase subunit type 1 TsaE [bacterium]|nr:MAG: tRNA (adenosine(37)-N6)-threonylcarbamoyltransferase complex ATPase subunit type 1 TsaE [bacterium]